MISFEASVALTADAEGGLGRCHTLERGRRGTSLMANDPRDAAESNGGSPAAKQVMGAIKAAGGA